MAKGNKNDNKPNKQTLKYRIYLNTLNFVAIFIIILLLIFGYYTGLNKNDEYIDINTLFNIAINPCDYSQQYSCVINEFIDKNCSNNTPHDIDMFEYILFILSGAYMLCSNVNDLIVNAIGTGLYTITRPGSVPKAKPDTKSGAPEAVKPNNTETKANVNISGFNIATATLCFMAIYTIFFYGMYGIKLGVVNSLFLYVFKQSYGNEFFYSFLSLCIFIFSTFLLINIILYVSYLFSGVMKSNSKRWMYVFMIFAAGFVFWITGFKLTFVEGFREGAKNKNKNKIQTASITSSSSKGKSKNKGGGSKCNDFNYVIPLAILLIVPVVATLITFFKLIFSGLYGIAMFFNTENNEIKSSLFKTIGCSLLALVIMWVLILVEKLIEITK